MSTTCGVRGYRGQRGREGIHLRARLAPHQQGHDARPGGHVLEERQLHLEGMLVTVRPLVRDHRAAGGDDPRRDGLVDLRAPERRLEGAAREHGDAVEGHPVGRADQHGGERAAPAQGGVGVRGHGPRIAQAGVGRDEPDDPPSAPARAAHPPGSARPPTAGSARRPDTRTRPSAAARTGRARRHHGPPRPGRKLEPTRYSSRGKRSRLTSVVDRALRRAVDDGRLREQPVDERADVHLPAAIVAGRERVAPAARAGRRGRRRSAARSRRAGRGRRARGGRRASIVDRVRGVGSQFTISPPGFRFRRSRSKYSVEYRLPAVGAGRPQRVGLDHVVAPSSLQYEGASVGEGVADARVGEEHAQAGVVMALLQRDAGCRAAARRSRCSRARPSPRGRRRRRASPPSPAR